MKTYSAHFSTARLHGISGLLIAWAAGLLVERNSSEKGKGELNIQRLTGRLVRWKPKEENKEGEGETLRTHENTRQSHRQELPSVSKKSKKKKHLCESIALDKCHSV